MTALPPGAVIGILGGGQLGRMLANAASQLGFDVHVFCPESDAPAARVAMKHWQADYSDSDALTGFARACDVVTLEFENIPVGAVEAIVATGTPLHPGAKSLALSQDRADEKAFLQSIGIATADYRIIDSDADIAPALAALGGKGVLKTRRDGYDGKGQAWLKNEADIAVGWESVGRAPCVLVDALGHVGVLALEFFVMADGRLIANEFAPRVHNSGHWTPEACQTGQFEQHIRAIAGWKLGDTHRLFDAEMINLIGTAGLVDPSSLAPNETLTLYGKREARAGRKMGHITRRLGARKD